MNFYFLILFTLLIINSIWISYIEARLEINQALNYILKSSQETIYNLNLSSPFLKQILDNKFAESLDNQYTPPDFICPNYDSDKDISPFYLLPVGKVRLTTEGAIGNLSNGCFLRNQVKIIKLSKEEIKLLFN